MTTFILDETNSALSGEEKATLAAADAREITPDEDCPEMTEEQYRYFSRLLAERRASRKTQVVSIRLTDETLKKAKMLGSGYTSVLGRIVEYGLDHPEILQKCV